MRSLCVVLHIWGITFSRREKIIKLSDYTIFFRSYKHVEANKINGMMSRARLSGTSTMIHFFSDIAAMKFSIFVISSRLFVVDAALWTLRRDCMSRNSNASLADSS